MKGMTLFFVIMLIGLGVNLAWNNVPALKDSVHSTLDPGLGGLLGWNPEIGMAIVALILTFISLLLQKYFTDQVTLKRIKEEQKLLQEEMKKYRDNPEKIMELQKKSFEIMQKTFDITLKPVLYTLLPIILLFSWFNDYFAINSIKFFGILHWLWYYLIVSIVASSILRKMMKVH